MKSLAFFRKSVLSVCVIGQALLYAQTVYAEEFEKQTQDDRRLDVQSFDKQIIPPPEPTIVQTPPPNMAMSVDETVLLNNPELLARAMLSALVYHNAEGVETLLPIYQKQAKESIETPMLVWANAVLATKKQDHTTAITLYQSLIKDYPENQLFRARLSQSLFANRQYKQAYALIKNDPELTQQLPVYLNAIDNLTKPNIRVGGNLIIDKNINNAPNKRDLGGGWTASEPIPAHGVAFHANFTKKFLLNDGMDITPDFTVRGKLYHDAKQYNEVSLRSSLNIGKRDAKKSVTISPFYELTYYAGAKKDQTELKHFSDSIGIRFYTNTKMGVDSQLSVSGEVAKHLYQTRKHLDGYSMSISPTFSTSIQTLGDVWLNIGLDYQKTITQDKDDSYRRIELSSSIAKQWQDIGANASMSIGKRNYLAPMPIFNKTQINHEYNTSISLWHNKLRYRNFTPRLTWQYQKTKSSIPLYNYDKKRVFIELSGTF